MTGCRLFLCLVAIAGASLADATELLWAKVICEEPTRMVAWPTACCMTNGEVIVVFSGDRDAHVCPWGRLEMIRSTDSGENWTAPEVVFPGVLDDREPHLFELPDGKLRLDWFSSDAFKNGREHYRLHYDKLGPDLIAKYRGFWSSCSSDGGRTWDRPVRHPEPAETSSKAALPEREAETPHFLKLPNGAQLCTYVVHGARAGIRLARSSDGGRSWARVDPLALPPPARPDFGSPVTVVTPDGFFLTVWYQSAKLRRPSVLFAAKWKL